VDLRADQPDARDLGRLDDVRHSCPLLPRMVPSREATRGTRCPQSVTPRLLAF
jgi:hypothetical protein